LFNKISDQANELVNLTNKIHKNSKTKVVAVTSGKGGVGKSTLTSNMAYILSKQGKKVAVLDADIGLANLQVLFDIKPAFTFFDYLEGTCKLDKILLPTSYPNITLIAGKSGYQYSGLNSSMHFSNVVSEIVALDIYDILLIDTGAGINEHVQEFLDITDNIVAITTTDPSALTDVYALMKMLSEKKEKLMLCFNYTPKYDIGATITKSLINLGQKNKLNSNFMVQYIGNVSEVKGIAITGRLRKLFAKELKSEIPVHDLRFVVENFLEHI